MRDGGQAAALDALPNLVVIGAMKCGTSALHALLGRHPEVAMSRPKELNFFFGPERADGAAAWAAGNWHRGLAWYARHFDPCAAVRGESSPGYTSPSHPEAAPRMAAVLPAARLVYLVRDPVRRAVSQYLHHRAEGTERRPLEQALLDPASQYLARSRYHERLAPFLACFARPAIALVCQEELLAEQRHTLRALFEFLQVDPGRWAGPAEAGPRPPEPPRLGRRLRQRLVAALRGDADRLRELAGRDFPTWSL
jgi:Sulfotransferase family